MKRAHPGEGIVNTLTDILQQLHFETQIFDFFHRKFLLWAVSQSWRAGEDFPVYESFKVELLQKICKSIHDVLSRMSALHSDDSISAFKNIGISWLQKVLALWNRLRKPKSTKSLQARLGSTSKLILEALPSSSSKVSRKSLITSQSVHRS